MKDWLRRFFRRITPSGSVLQRTVKSGIWVSATKMSLRLSQVLMLIVLARFLPPRAFGLIGIALLTLSAMRRFTEIGLDAALIQQKADNVDEYLDTTWSLEIGRGLLIFGVLFVSAPYIASFFDEPQAGIIIQVLSVSPLLRGLRNPAVVYFRKDLAFHKEFVYQASGGVSQLVVAVGYVLYSPTVWALVFASISRPAVQTVLSYWLHDYCPWPSPNLEAAKELVDYGKWITGASIVRFVYSQGDDAFVGWFLTASSLGFYQYAYRIADLPATELSGIVSQITFPAYSQLQENMEELRDALLQTTRLTAFVTFPIAFGIALVAPSFVRSIIGSEWVPMILTMQVLAMYGLMHSITRNFGAVWKSLDRPDLITKTGIVRIVCIAIFIWPATARWGFEGTAFVVTGVYLVPMLPLDVYLTSKVTETSSIAFYMEYLYPCIAAGTMFGVLWYARGLVELSPLVEFVLLVPSGAIVYVLVSALLEWQFDWGIERILRMIARGVR